jgi:threonine dehydrogenase-like Zn-dependent dehydrogenase
MRAVTYHGTHDFRVDTHPDPSIKDPKDAILRVTSTAICGSDLHLYDGFIPAMRKGDIIGHEFMGIVEEVGPEVTNLRKGDRVVIPFTVNCGRCHWCERELYSLCDESNPDHEALTKLTGQSAGGLFGYSHLYGGYDGGQAEYVRIPFADATHLKVPQHLSDEQVLFLTDIFPTGWQGAVNAGVTDGSTVAIWGAGPVGLFALQSARILGAERVFVIDSVPERLALAAAHGAETIDASEAKPYDVLMERTDGMLPECTIDCVGTEAHGHGWISEAYDKIKTATFQDDRPGACHPRGDLLHAEGRHRLDPGRLRRGGRQVPARRGLRQGAQLQDGADPRTPARARAARPHRGGAARPDLPDHPSRHARGCPRIVQDVPRQEGRLHQGRPHPMTPPTSPPEASRPGARLSRAGAPAHGRRPAPPSPPRP